VGFLLFAASNISTDIWQGQPVSNQEAPDPWGTVVAFAGSLVWISLSYSGFNAAVYVAEEARGGRRTIPKALMVGTCAVTFFYVLLNAVFVYAPPPEAIAGKPDVAAIAAEWIGGKGLGTGIRWIISLALLTSVSSMLMAAPRVYAKMAEDGFLPRQIARGAIAPRAAIALQAVLASIMVLASTLRDLLSYLGLTLSLCAVLSVGCLFLPKIRRASFLQNIPPAFYILCSLMAATLMTIGNPYQLAATTLTFGVGALVYLIWGRDRFRPEKLIVERRGRRK
jgi:APA family basic amino acid/polyamine antiporter